MRTSFGFLGDNFLSASNKPAYLCAAQRNTGNTTVMVKAAQAAR
jgi:hypothetical protein